MNGPLATAVILALVLTGSAASPPSPLSLAPRPSLRSDSMPEGTFERVDAGTTLVAVIDHPAFEDFGRFLFPSGRGMPDSAMTLRDGGNLLPYHTHVDVDASVDVVNALMDAVEHGHTAFCGIYPDDERSEDRGKGDTGLFYFRGQPDAPFAIVSAGGGFS